jgi:hypothetical protein
MMRIFNRLFSVVSSPQATVFLLLALLILVVGGTIFQVNHSLYETQRTVFNAWIVFPLPFFPFPGVKLVILLLILNLVAAGAKCKRLSIQSTGLLLVHCGIAVLFIGAGLGLALRQESSLTLSEGESSSIAQPARNGPDSMSGLQLPFTVQLQRFILKHSLSSGALEDYESRIHVLGSAIDRDVVISMNRPFRYRDFTFYQSSYREDQGRMASTLAVVKNPLRAVPYLAGIMIAAGLLFHFLLRFFQSAGNKHA